jgi:nitrate/nitrite transport system substrate-binding protein
MKLSLKKSRRNLLKGAAVLAAFGPAACSKKDSGDSQSRGMPVVLGADKPEVADVRFGMIALTDCSPIVIAHERGLFAKYGIHSTIVKGASWAAIRDSLSNGDLQATHMLLGMPLASTLGLSGSPKVPMVAPWLLNRNGQAITLRASFKGKVASDPKALKPFVDEAKAKGSPLTFAATFPPGTHAMWMRYFLAAGGIHPDKDVSLATVPPPQMVANMKVDKMDGFCVGEPWGARAISEGIGFTAITSQTIWPNHPEKVCAFRADFAEKNPKTVKAILKALHEASVWLDDMKNRAQGAELVAKPTYINCDPESIKGRLLGHYDYGDGRKEEDPHPMIFSTSNCNYPQPKYAKWFISQFKRWGMLDAPVDYEKVARDVMRTDLYEEAMRELGYAHGGRDDSPERFFDGHVFEPAEPEKYALSFDVRALKG